MAKAERYKGYENPEAHRANVERTRSNAATPHKDKRTKRARTRNAAERRAIKEGE